MNKKIELLVCILFLFLFNKIYSQVTVNVNPAIIKIVKYTPVFSKEKICFLKMAFGSYQISNKSEINLIKNLNVKKVQLYYTSYPNTSDMSLLNKKRLLSLYMIAPELFDNKNIIWEFVEQTGANASNVHDFFHGIVITCEKNKDISESENSRLYFKNIITGETPMQDSSVYKILERNEWDDLLIVCDMTGSMSPYIVQVLFWFNLHNAHYKNSVFIFFNDGDSKNDSLKIIGKTGGIYQTESYNIDSIINTAITAINGGNGGDKPENDIEAVLFALNNFPEKKSVILIADNSSNMRDYELVENVAKPVKVILCGSFDKINPQYLGLAYKSKGSVHTIESDLMDLMKRSEGSEIKIDGQKFLIKNGEFIETY